MRMPFGKRKGRRLEGIPVDSLLWLLTIDLTSALQVGVERELKARRLTITPKQRAPMDRREKTEAGPTMSVGVRCTKRNRLGPICGVCRISRAA